MVYHFDSRIDTGGNRRMVIGSRLLAVCILASAGPLGISSVIGYADTAKPVMNPKAKRGPAIFHQNCVSSHNNPPHDSTPFVPPNLHRLSRRHPMVPPPLTP